MKKIIYLLSFSLLLIACSDSGNNNDQSIQPTESYELEIPGNIQDSFIVENGTEYYLKKYIVPNIGLQFEYLSTDIVNFTESTKGLARFQIGNREVTLINKDLVDSNEWDLAATSIENADATKYCFEFEQKVKSDIDYKFNCKYKDYKNKKSIITYFRKDDQMHKDVVTFYKDIMIHMTGTVPAAGVVDTMDNIESAQHFNLKDPYFNISLNSLVLEANQEDSEKNPETDNLQPQTNDES